MLFYVCLYCLLLICCGRGNNKLEGKESRDRLISRLFKFGYLSFAGWMNQNWKVFLLSVYSLIINILEFTNSRIVNIRK